MSGIDDQLAADRAARNAAKSALDERVAHLREALDERSVKGRMVDEALARAQAGADEALAVASDSRWVLVGTVVALGAWFARRPLGKALRGAMAGARAEPSARWPRWLDRVFRKERT